MLGWSTSACMESGGRDKETDFWVRRTKNAQMHEKVSVLNEDCIGTLGEFRRTGAMLGRELKEAPGTK